MSGGSSHHDVKTAHYGTWDSPLSSDIVTGQVIGLESPRVAANGKIYYLERRASGRNIIVEIADGKSRDVLSENYNPRSSVHEYGGGAYQLTPNGDIVFTDADSKAVYLLKPATGEVKKILEKKNCRYGDFEIHPNSKWIAAIEEDHTDPEPKDVVNRLALFDFESGKTSTLRSGRDFFIGPCFSHDGKRIAWLEYNHPNMPWTGAELHVADFTASGKLENDTHVAGKGGEESAQHHLWAPDGRLFFARDRTGFWQLSYLKPGSTTAQDFPLKGLEDADIGEPEWQLAPHSRAILPGGKTMIAISWKQATAEVISIDLSSGQWKPLNLPFRDLRGDVLAAHSDDSIVILGATATKNRGLFQVSVSSPSNRTLLKTSLDYTLSEDYISLPEHISCPTTNNQTTYGFYYAPKNPSYKGPSDTLPPLVLWAHGGPTGCVTASFNLGIQYFTSRGYAVFDINYRGSSGYGRDYIRQLDGVWGIADSDDGAAVVSYLAERKLIDKSRAGVRGGSAGGYFTIQAVCYPDIFAAGNSLFGISDLRSFVYETHKFESKYADGLLFPKDASDAEKEQIIVDRSAISHVEKISAPLLLLQGTEDKIVPPGQSSDLLEAARKVGKTVEMTLYDGEGHGFRKAANLKDSLEREEAWWRKYLLREWVQ